MNRLNLGCGKIWEEQYPEYEGLDIKDFGQIWVGDVLKVLPSFPDQFYGEVMANHFLEHFSQDDLKIIFRQVHRILADDGIFKIIVPHKDKGDAWILSHKTFWAPETFKRLAEPNFNDTYGFGNWVCRELVTNSRMDICVEFVKRCE